MSDCIHPSGEYQGESVDPTTMKRVWVYKCNSCGQIYWIYQD